MATQKKQAVPVGKKKSVSTGAKVGVGASLTAAALAAAGAYFLYGSKHAAKNRKKVAGWVEDAKKEVVKGLEKAKTMSEAEYKELVERVSKAHGELSKISKADLAKFQKEMKDGWKTIAKNAIGAVAAVKPAMPAAAKPATAKKAPAVKKAVAKPAAPAPKKKPVAK